VRLFGFDMHGATALHFMAILSVMTLIACDKTDVTGTIAYSSDIQNAPLSPSRSQIPPGNANRALLAGKAPSKGATANDLHISSSVDDRQVLYGVDLSKWNASILDNALASGIIHFVILRATYGRTVDPTFNANWEKLNARRVPHGAYHFYLVSQSPIDQLKVFLDLYSRSGDLALPPIVDFEELSFAGLSVPPPISKVQGDLITALEYLAEKTGKLPIIYTDLPTGNRYLNDARFSRYPLYIADWTTRSSPNLPDAWKDIGFRFWQRSATYFFESAPETKADLDIFFGTPQDLIRGIR
jgi:GH25 family lysozyme M1 (1,4-beta-N-acetylmuramidase)